MSSVVSAGFSLLCVLGRLLTLSFSVPSLPSTYVYQLLMMMTMMMMPCLSVRCRRAMSAHNVFPFTHPDPVPYAH